MCEGCYVWGLLSSGEGMWCGPKQISLLPLVANAVNLLIVTTKPQKVLFAYMKTSQISQLKEVTYRI